MAENMEEGEITPIYGYWIKENLEKYIFRSNEAKLLKSAFEDIDLESTGCNNKFIELYKNFLELFCNNMFTTAFKMTGKALSENNLNKHSAEMPYTQAFLQNEKGSYFHTEPNGIISYEIDAYLVKNEYGVMTPIGLLKENNKSSLYDIEFNLLKASDRIKEYEGKMYNQFILNQNKIDEITEKKTKPSRKRSVIGLLLSFIIICIIYAKRDLIFNSINENMMWVWLVICILSILLIIEALTENIKAKAWKSFMQNCLFFKTMMVSVSDIEQSLLHYRDEINLAIQEDAQSLPVNTGIFNNYSKFLNRKITNIEKTIKYPARVRKSYGILSFIISMVILIFIAFGSREPYYSRTVDFINKIGHSNTSKLGSEDNNDTDISEDDKNENNNVFIGYEKINVKKTGESSYLYSKSTNTSYSAANTCDGNISTSWQDGVTGDGIGEYVEYFFDGIKQLIYLDIYNGNLYSEKKYWDNNRPSIIKVDALRDGEVIVSMEYYFEDIYTIKPTTIYLGSDSEPIDCDKIMIYILDVYHGAVYKDTCISEVEFYAGSYLK